MRKGKAEATWKHLKRYFPLLVLLSILPILLAADISGATLKAPFTIENVGSTDAMGVPTTWTMAPTPLQEAGLLNAAADNIAICAAEDCTGTNELPIDTMSPELVEDQVQGLVYDGCTGNNWAPNFASNNTGAVSVWTRDYAGSYLEIQSYMPFTSFHFDLMSPAQIPLETTTEWQYQTSNGGWTALDVVDTSNKFGVACSGCTVSWDMPDQWYVDDKYRIRLYQLSGSSCSSNSAAMTGGSMKIGNALWYSTVDSIASGATDANTMYLGGPSMSDGGGPSKFPIYHGAGGMAWSGNPYYYTPYYGLRLEISGYWQTESVASNVVWPNSCAYSIVCLDSNGNGFQLWIEAPGELAAAMNTSSYGYVGGPGRFDSIPITDGYHTLVIETPASCSYQCGYAYVDGVQVATMHNTWSYFSFYGYNPFAGGSGYQQGPSTSYNTGGLTYVDHIKYEALNYGTSENREWKYETQWDGWSSIPDENNYTGYPTLRGTPCVIPWNGVSCAAGGGGTTVNDRYYRPGSVTSPYPLTATIGAFESTAGAPPAADTSLAPVDVVSANMTGNFASDTAVGTLPGSAFIQGVATSANIPAKFIWVLIACGLVILVMGAAMKFLKNMVLASVIGGIVLTGFSVPAVGVFPIWVVFFFAVVATVVVIIGKRLGVSV